VSVDFPVLDYESAALTIELRARFVPLPQATALPRAYNSFIVCSSGVSEIAGYMGNLSSCLVVIDRR
jgi:hypothetical protein